MRLSALGFSPVHLNAPLCLPAYLFAFNAYPLAMERTRETVAIFCSQSHLDPRHLGTDTAFSDGVFFAPEGTLLDPTSNETKSPKSTDLHLSRSTDYLFGQNCDGVEICCKRLARKTMQIISESYELLVALLMPHRHCILLVHIYSPPIK